MTERTYTPEQLRHRRETLGLSRHDVEDHTGLASSVVWRSEQGSRKITDEQYRLIECFLKDTEVNGKATCCGKKSGKAKSGMTASEDSQVLHQQVQSLKAALAERDNTIKQLHNDLTDANAKAEILGKNITSLHQAGIDLQTWVDQLTKRVQKEIDDAKAKKASTAALKRILDAVQQ